MRADALSWTHLLSTVSRARNGLFCSLLGALAACAPDLAIGSGAGGTGGSGGTTATGGSGGTTSTTTSTTSTSSTSGDRPPGTELHADFYNISGVDIPQALMINDTAGVAQIAADTINGDGVPQITSFQLSRHPDGLWYFYALGPVSGGPHAVTGLTMFDHRFYFAGSLSGDIPDMVPMGTIASHGGSDCLVGDFWSGEPWFRAIGAEGYSACAGVVPTQNGILVAGTFTATLDKEVTTGNGTLFEADGHDMFLTELTPDGSPIASYQLGGARDQKARALGTDATGNIYLLGSDDSASDVGHADIVLHVLTSSGQTMPPRVYGGALDERPLALAVAPDGATAIAGTMASPLDLGGGALAGDAFVAVFDPTGTLVWSHGFQDEQGDVDIRALRFDDAHRLFVGGDFTSSMTVAGQELTSEGGDDAFLVAFEADGGLRWAKSWGDGKPQSIGALAFTGDGTLLAVGHLDGTMVLAGETVQGFGDLNPFLVELVP